MLLRLYGKRKFQHKPPLSSPPDVLIQYVQCIMYKISIIITLYGLNISLLNTISGTSTFHSENNIWILFSDISFILMRSIVSNVNKINHTIWVLLRRHFILIANILNKISGNRLFVQFKKNTSPISETKIFF